MVRCLHVPLASGIWELAYAGSRPSRARCECGGVAWEAFNLLESGELVKIACSARFVLVHLTHHPVYYLLEHIVAYS